MKKDYLSRLNFNPFLTNLLSAAVVLCLTAFAARAQVTATIQVTAPANIAGDYDAAAMSFGSGLDVGVSGPVALGIDTSGMSALGCGGVTVDLTGQIALIDRGACSFVEKATQAQAAGAIGVIICNNRTDVPDNAFAVYDAAPDVMIPTVMTSYNICQAIRVEIGNGLMVTLNDTGRPATAGEICDAAVGITAGTYTVDPIDSGFGVVNYNVLGQQYYNGGNAAWYSYTPTSNALVTVRSCGLTTVDTRLAVLTGPDCQWENLTEVGLFDDCDPDNANFASEGTFLATAGTTYYIYWDDRWSAEGFDFELVEEALPAVDVSFTVDMSNEVVSPDGVSMVWAFSDATDITDVSVVALADNGDGTWSGTVSLTSFDTIGYAFMNGLLDPANIEAVPGECGLDSGFGFNIRPLIVNSADPITLPNVCFGTCSEFCPSSDCAQAPVLMENLDNYITGEFVGPQSDDWTVWPGGTEGGPEDAPVSDEQAFSAPNSVKIEGNNGPDDVVLNLGGQSEGLWDLRFKIYVEPGFGGYYNLQNTENAAAPNTWTLEVDFNTDGTLGNDVTGTYTPGTWVDVVHIIDLDNDRAELIIEGKSVYTWDYPWNIGSFDFFASNFADQLFYIDDVVLRPMDPCPAGAIICDGFEPYTLGPVSDQSANWGPWTSSPADDGVVQDDPNFVYSGCQSLLISAADPDDQLLLLGDRTEGNYLLEWQMFVPEGNAGYYNFQKFQDNPGGEYAIQVEFFTDGTATLDAGAEDVVTWDWTAGQWMHIQYFIDLDNDWTVMMIDGQEIYSFPISWGTFQQSGTKQIGSIDFYGNTDVVQYLDEVHLIQLPSMPGNACAGAVDIQNLFGQGVDVPATSGIYDNTNYTSTGQDPTTGYECFAEPGTGAPTVPTLERTTWFTFVGDGAEYYMTTVQCDAPDEDYNADTQIAVYSGDGCGSLTPVTCGEDIDLPNGIYEAEVTIATEPGTTYYVMVDGFGPEFESFGQYCLQVTQLSLPAVTVTLNVDMSLVDMVAAEGVHVAGNFQGWVPDATPLNDNGDGTWSVDVVVDPNQTLEFKFINGNAWGADEGQPGTNLTTDCGVDNGNGGINRTLEVGEDDIVTEFVCFDYCVTCNVVGVDETALAQGVKVFPNPARSLLNVRVDLPEAADNLTVRMLNAFGQVIKEGYYGAMQNANIEIDVTDVPAGAYMIQVMDGKAQFTQSVIVE